MSYSFFIDTFKIDDKSPVFIIAELSANHNGSFENAVATIQAAKRAGADAIKLQTYLPDTLTIDSDNEFFQIKEGLWEGRTLYELYQEAYTPWEWHETLFKVAADEGLICFSTPFDKTAVDFLEKLNNPIYKIASFEIQDIPLIEYAASKGKPMIISTGIAELEDINLAVKTCKNAGNPDITLLKCTSAYPAPIEEANLASIPNLKETFRVNVGLSDHTLGSSVSIASVAFGASVIERHFILDRNLGGPDAAFSMEPEEFKQMVKSIREVEQAIGEVSYVLTGNQKKNRVFSRSLFIVKDIQAGEILTEENIRSIRPGYGLHPKYMQTVIGKRAKSSIFRGSPLKWELFE